MFLAVCAAVHRNHFFCFYQKDQSSDSKVNFRQASNRFKRSLEAAKLAYANKTRVRNFTETWFTGLFFNKDKSAIPPPFNDPEVLPSASNKAKLFAGNFSKNSNLDDSGISLPVFFLEVI